MNDRQIVLRVPGRVMERAERLARILAQTREYEAVRLTPSTILRFAILQGLETLERGAGKRRR